MSARAILSLSLSLVLSPLLAACGEDIDDPTATPSQVAITMPSGDAARIVELVNYPGTDLATLDDAVGLDIRAANNLLEHRNGDDNVAPSADDVLFVDLADLDAVPFVGDMAFGKLRAYAAAHPAPAAESVEGVSFSGWEAEAVVWAINHDATLQELDVAVGLDNRAAANLLSSRPYASVTAMGPVSYVGTSALDKLRARAPIWWGRLHGAATSTVVYDGVEFDAVTAAAALEIANLATRDQLLAAGMWSTGATRVISGRPYATLAAVAAVEGVGTSTVQALHDYATSGTWTPPGTCTAPALVSRAHPDAEDMTRLVALATTNDWPYAEVVALQASCLDMTSATDRAALLTLLRNATQIHWSYDPSLRPRAEDFITGAGRYVAMNDEIPDVIHDRIAEGLWSPANPDEQALFDSLDGMRASLTDAPRANPTHYYETGLYIDAGECSEGAFVIVDPDTLAILLIHRFPLC